MHITLSFDKEELVGDITSDMLYALSIQEFLRSGNMTEAGPIGLIDDKSDIDLTPTLPGVLKGNLCRCAKPVLVHATTIISL